MLFLHHINDIYIASDIFNILLYADDTTFLCTHMATKLLYTKVNVELDFYLFK